MTYYQLITELQNTAKQDPNIRFTGAGNIYELNNKPDINYRVFYITPNLSTSYEDVDQYSLNLFYIDRWDDSTNNQTEIQSAGKTILTDIINRFVHNHFEVDVEYPFQFQFFYERFADVCAGCWVTITFIVDSDVCSIGENY